MFVLDLMTMKCREAMIKKEESRTATTVLLSTRNERETRRRSRQWRMERRKPETKEDSGCAASFSI